MIQQERYATTNRHGYSVRYSPFNPTIFACATAQNYGIQGRGTLFILDYVPGTPIRLVKAFEWPYGLYDVTWSELEEDVVIGAGADGNIIFIALNRANVPRLILKGHTKEVYSIDWSQTRQEQLLLSGSWDHLVKVWDPEAGNLLSTFTGHTNKVYAVAWSPRIPGLFSSVAGDGSLCLWNLQQPAPLAAIPAHSCEILCCDWSKYDQHILATGGIDNLIRGWDLRNAARPLFELRGHGYAVRKVKFSPHSASVLASASYDFSTRLWDWKESTEALLILKNHKEFTYGLDFNLHVQNQIADCSWDQTICISQLPDSHKPQ